MGCGWCPWSPWGAAVGAGGGLGVGVGGVPLSVFRVFSKFPGTDLIGPQQHAPSGQNQEPPEPGNEQGMGHLQAGPGDLGGGCLGGERGDEQVGAGCWCWEGLIARVGFVLVHL